MQRPAKPRTPVRFRPPPPPPAPGRQPGGVQGGGGPDREGGRRAERARRLPRRSVRGIFLPAARQHGAQGDRGRARARGADSRRGGAADSRASEALAAAPRAGLGRAGGGESPAGGGHGRVRMVLSEVPRTGASGGCEREGHRRRSAAAVRGVLPQRREAPLREVRPPASRQGGRVKRPPPHNLSRARKAAKWLLAAHQRRERFGRMPPELAPRTSEEAYLIQDDFVALRADELGPVVGYKIALTTPQMRKMMGVDSPQAGAMLESTIRRSPATVRAADFVNLIVEFELAMALAEDLPAAGAPFSRERVAQAVGAVMPAFELLDDRGADYAEGAKRPLEP